MTKREDSRPRVPRTLLVALLILAVATPALVCWYRGSSQATRYWRDLENKSVEVTAAFLGAAAHGDSAEFAPLASDSLVAWLGKEGTPPVLVAMARAAGDFESQPPRVYVLGTGAIVTFKYRFEGHVRQGGVDVGLERDRWVVTDFSESLKVN